MNKKSIILIISAIALILTGCSFLSKNPTSKPSTQSGLTELESKIIAEKNCIKGGESLSRGYYNANSKTWWFDANLNATKEGCNPACVVSEATKTAEINWRCTGLIAPEETSKQSKNNIFSHKLFSIKLPASYSENSNVIQPLNKKDFSQIVFSIANETIEASKLLEKEKTYFNSLCGQTNACGKITSSSTITINGKNGVKFTVQYKGRGADDTNGYINEYYYSILNGKNLLRFWVSASDLENPDSVNKAFDKIMETISFK